MDGRMEGGADGLYCQVTGGGGATVVLLHALAETGRAWQPCLEDLRGLRAISVDLPGFGESPNVGESDGLQEYARRLELVIEAQGLGSVVLAGVAFGGFVALELYARRPDLVRGMVLGAVGPVIDSGNEEYLKKRLLVLEREGMAGVVEQSLDRSYPKSIRRDDGGFAGYRESFLETRPAGYRDASLALAGAGEGPGRILATVSRPTAILAGSLDPLFPPAEVRAAADLVPAPSLVEFAELVDVGHLIHVQAPQRFATSIRRVTQSAAFRDER